jgi:sodium transport system ATP-binding protein
VLRAVDGVSFRCEPGRIHGLLGANGAGKTTTLRMLATILAPTSGTAVVAGHDVVRDPARVRHDVGFLSTATALYGRLTAREMVEYFGRLHHLDEALLKERIDALFTRLDMHGFADRRCDKLSTGMKQKVSIARTLVHDPAVMIFDEPTLGLDVMSARTIVGFIRDCRDKGKTVLFSSHVMSEVEKLCDFVGIIHQGRLQRVERPGAGGDAAETVRTWRLVLAPGHSLPPGVLSGAEPVEGRAGAWRVQGTLADVNAELRRLLEAGGSVNSLRAKRGLERRLGARNTSLLGWRRYHGDLRTRTVLLQLFGFAPDVTAGRDAADRGRCDGWPLPPSGPPVIPTNRATVSAHLLPVWPTPLRGWLLQSGVGQRAHTTERLHSSPPRLTLGRAQIRPR